MKIGRPLEGRASGTTPGPREPASADDLVLREGFLSDYGAEELFGVVQVGIP